MTQKPTASKASTTVPPSDTQGLANTPHNLNVPFLTDRQPPTPTQGPFHGSPHTQISQTMSPPATQTFSPLISFQQYLQDRAPSESFFLGNINIPTKLLELVNGIHKSCFAMASDGSVRSPNGSFSWVIYGMHSKQYLTGHNTLTGGHSDLSTFRTEACGYLGVLSALKAILTVFPLPPLSSHITSEPHIDKLGVVRRSQDTPFSIQQCLQPDWDIMHAAYNIRLSLLAIITVLHVWEHQDNTTADLTSLPLSAHLNIVADSGTHQAYKTRPHFQQTPPLPSTQATLVLNRSRVTFKMTTHASLAYYWPVMADYFQHKFGRDNITCSIICGTHLLCRLPLCTNVDPKCTSLCFRTSRSTQDSRATKTNVIDLL